MWEEIFNLAIKNGLWAVLFTGLLVYVIKDSRKREKEYQELIKELSESLAIVKDIKQNVDKIKAFVFEKNSKSKSINIAKKSKQQ